jgi:hypothetical protein
VEEASGLSLPARLTVVVLELWSCVIDQPDPSHSFGFVPVDFNKLVPVIFLHDELDLHPNTVTFLN